MHTKHNYVLASLICSSAFCLSAAATNVEQADFKLVNGLGVLHVEAPRPVAYAAQTLAAQYKALITYEDPRYADSDDIVDRAAVVRKDYSSFPVGKAPKVLGPVGGVLSINFSAKDIAHVLQQLVQAQAKSGVGGRFQIETTGSAYHIVPSQVRDSNGNWMPQQSILDVPISFEALPRSRNELLSVICGAVAQANSRGLKMLPPGPESDQPPQYVIGANEEVARSVLFEALTAIAAETGPLTWVIYYDVESGNYYISFPAAPIAMSSTSNAAMRETRARPQGAKPSNGVAVPTH